jgi:hypothetical protein
MNLNIQFCPYMMHSALASPRSMEVQTACGDKVMVGMVVMVSVFKYRTAGYK